MPVVLTCQCQGQQWIIGEGSVICGKCGYELCVPVNNDFIRRNNDRMRAEAQQIKEREIGDRLGCTLMEEGADTED